MKKMLILSFLTLFIGVTGLASQADAKRFGGGKSFGSSFKSNKSFSKPAPQSTPAGQKASPAQGSKGGMMGGMLGGLVMGGLLGAMFFGGGFEGINFMDILLFAGIGFAIFWFIRKSAGARREEPEYAHAGHQGSPVGNHESDATPNNDAFTSSAASSSAAETPDIDPEFFNQAARDIFMRMQASWDAKDMQDIRDFCRPDVAKHVEEEMNNLGDNTNRTDVGMLNVDIEEMWIEAGFEYVAVKFQAMLNEQTMDAAGKVIETESSTMQERWIFQHQPDSDDPTWYLASIQQG